MKKNFLIGGFLILLSIFVFAEPPPLVDPVPIGTQVQPQQFSIVPFSAVNTGPDVVPAPSETQGLGIIEQIQYALTPQDKKADFLVQFYARESVVPQQPDFVSGITTWFGNLWPFK